MKEGLLGFLKSTNFGPESKEAIIREGLLASGVEEASEPPVPSSIKGLLQPQMAQPDTSDKLVGFLSGDVVDLNSGRRYGVEGNEASLYVPEGGDSGLTLGVGIDLKHQNKGSLGKLGVPEPIIEKLSPFFGRSGKEGDGKDSVGVAPLNDQELAILNKSVVNGTVERLKELVPNFNELPSKLQQAAYLSLHQYGEKRFKSQKFKDQLVKGEFDEATKNLRNWGDRTKGRAGQIINAKYKALGTQADGELKGSPKVLERLAGGLLTI